MIKAIILMATLVLLSGCTINDQGKSEQINKITMVNSEASVEMSLIDDDIFCITGFESANNCKGYLSNIVEKYQVKASGIYDIEGFYKEFTGKSNVSKDVIEFKDMLKSSSSNISSNNANDTQNLLLTDGISKTVNGEAKFFDAGDYTDADVFKESFSVNDYCYTNITGGGSVGKNDINLMLTYVVTYRGEVPCKLKYQHWSHMDTAFSYVVKKNDMLLMWIASSRDRALQFEIGDNDAGYHWTLEAKD